MVVEMPGYVCRIIETLNMAGFRAYAVGGCVRDSLMGVPPHDWDVCTNARPKQVEACFTHHKTLETGIKHGTVTVIIDKNQVEITTFRTEGGYSDNRRPDSVTFIESLEEDLKRRDFTINAMAYDGALIDLFGGQSDIAAGIIRCVGCPEDRFGEDALRILRALRFASRLDFEIEPGTENGIHKLAGLLNNIAAERIFAELKGILAGKGAGRIIREYADVFAVIMPEIKPCIGFLQNNPAHYLDVWQHTAMAVDNAPQDITVRLALLLHDIGKPEKYFVGENGVGHFYGHPAVSRQLAEKILDRLHCDRKTRDEVLTLVEHHDDTFPAVPGGICRLAARYGTQTLQRLFDVHRADIFAHSPQWAEKKIENTDNAQRMFDEIMLSDSCLSVKQLDISGRDVLALGIPEGKEVGQVLDMLLEAVMDEKVRNTKTELTEFVIKYIKNKRIQPN